MHTEPGLIAATPQLGRYTIDPEHSAITSRTRHLFGLAPVRGAFAIRSGTADIAEPLAGALTVGDVTRPLGLTVAYCAASRQSFTARATARIDRTDFGITAARGLAGRYLSMTVEVQCARI